jgi:hypothetical protein
MANQDLDQIEKIREAYFLQGDDLIIKQIPKKHSKKFILFQIVSEIFDKDREYKEKEINELLKPIYPDYCMVRRYLVDFGLLERTLDGSVYKRR